MNFRFFFLISALVSTRVIICSMGMDEIMEAEGLCGGQAIAILSSNLQTIIKGTRQREKSWNT